ncbi:C-type mannose receptor 2-like [Gambusia affinis]|uniref:C-type mannose receptor 2-like n=1 Tax=Gambusia affinis TaxID=33528 RepID=UPI001CDD59C1|nr:C-type mannose receptor 2-like [Gambusia affinis]
MEKVLLYITGASALWVVSTLAKIHFHFVYEPMIWSDAQSYCRKTYTDLVTVDSAKVVTTLRIMVDSNKMAAITDAWIGLYDDVDSWRWSLSDDTFYQNSEALYRNWPSGQPDNSQGGEGCLEMLGNGEWNDNNCDNLRKVICSTVSGQTATFRLINTFMNWTQAQSYCRTHHTDLASVRHSADNENIKAAKPAGEAVWLGLFRDRWKWSKGSLLTYSYWGSGEPNGPVENCAIMDFTNSGRWVDEECRLTKPFICSDEVPSTDHVMKVKLVGSSSVDLKDGAVQGGLLNQLQQKLKDQGVTAEIRLRWMKQPDGNVFYQEKQDDHN